jgi:ABC-2 type transport system permease protein
MYMLRTWRRWAVLVQMQTRILLMDTSSLISNFTLAIASMVVFGLLVGGDRASTSPICVVDLDGSPVAAQVQLAFQSSDLVNSAPCGDGPPMESLHQGKVAAVVVLPVGFGSALQNGQTTAQVTYDAAEPARGAQARSTVAAVMASVNSTVSAAPQSIQLADTGGTPDRRPLRQIDWLTPGMVGLMIMLVNLVVGATLILWRDRGVLKRLAVTPLRPLQLMLSETVSRVVFSLVQVALLLVVARVLFGVEVMGSYLDLTLVAALGALAMLASGFAIAAFVPKFESAQAITSLAAFPMMLFGGSYFALDNAPGYLRPFIDAMPLTYLNHALREIMLYGAGISAVGHDLLVLAAWTALALVVATRAFRWE